VVSSGGGGIEVTCKDEGSDDCGEGPDVVGEIAEAGAVEEVDDEFQGDDADDGGDGEGDCIGGEGDVLDAAEFIDFDSLEEGSAEDCGDGDEEAEFSGPTSAYAGEKCERDGESAAAEAWHEGESLADADDAGMAQGELPEAEATADVVGPPEEQAGDCESDGDGGRACEDGFEGAFERKADEAGDENCEEAEQSEFDGEVLVEFDDFGWVVAQFVGVAEDAAAEVLEAFAEDEDDGEDGADMDDQVEEDHFRCIGFGDGGAVISHQMISENHVGGGAYREEHEGSLDNPEDDGLGDGHSHFNALEWEMSQVERVNKSSDAP